LKEKNNNLKKEFAIRIILTLIVLFSLESCSKDDSVSSLDPALDLALENISYSMTDLSCETDGFCAVDYSVYNGSEHPIRGEMDISLNYICANETFLTTVICTDEINLIASYSSNVPGSGFYSSSIVCAHTCDTRAFEQLDTGLAFKYEAVTD